MAAASMITTVLFDADGVLQRPGPVHAHFDRQHGWPREKLDGFLRHPGLSGSGYLG